MNTFLKCAGLCFWILCLGILLETYACAQPESVDQLSGFGIADLVDSEITPDDVDAFRVEASDVKETVKQVLADPEYRHLFQKLSTKDPSEQKLPQWLEDFLKWLFGGTNSRRTPASADEMIAFSTILFWIVVLIVAGMLITLLISLLSFEEKDSASFLDQIADQEALAPTQPPGDLPTNEYERRAVLAAHAGDFRTGMRELVLGSMSWCERSGMIRYRRGLTNRDYVRAIWRLEDKRKSMLKIVSIFEYIFYGRRNATAKAFNVCLEEFRKSFSEEGQHAQMED